MMKRALSMILCAALILSLAACGGKDTEKDKDRDPSSKDDRDDRDDRDEQSSTDLFPWLGDQDSEDGNPGDQEPEAPQPQEPEKPEPPQEPEKPEEPEPQETIAYTFKDGVLTIGGKGVLDKAALETCGAKAEALDTGGTLELVVKDGITEIASETFYNVGSITSVTLPGTLKKIGSSAFGNCYSLTSVTIPASVTEIGKSAFEDCRVLTDVTLPKGLTKIEERTFCNCYSLTSVTVPVGVTEIGPDAFNNCKGLVSVTIPASVTEIGKGAFNSCQVLASVALSEGLTKIGERAFTRCSSLGFINIPASVTEIQKEAFYNCSNMFAAAILNPSATVAEDAFGSNVTIRNKPIDPAGDAKALLALLKKEYQSDTAIGFTGKHSFLISPMLQAGSYNQSYRMYAHGNTLYIQIQNQSDSTWFAFDLTTKTQTPLTSPDFSYNIDHFIDGAINYFDPSDRQTLVRDDLHGNTTRYSTPEDFSSFPHIIYYGGGFLCYTNIQDLALYTLDFQKIASIPVPQQEVAHGLIEDVQMSGLRCVGGFFYAQGNNEHMYRLDPMAQTPEWSDMGETNSLTELQRSIAYGNLSMFLGKYSILSNGSHFLIVDTATAETVFESSDLPRPMTSDRYKYYFGGDCYITRDNGEYFKVNLATNSVSDPLKVPEEFSDLCFVSEDYLVYTDQYGIFLWNVNTEEESTIVMYPQN